MGPSATADACSLKNDNITNTLLTFAVNVSNIILGSASKVTVQNNQTAK